MRVVATAERFCYLLLHQECAYDSGVARKPGFGGRFDTVDLGDKSPPAGPRGRSLVVSGRCTELPEDQA